MLQQEASALNSPGVNSPNHLAFKSGKKMRQNDKSIRYLLKYQTNQQMLAKISIFIHNLLSHHAYRKLKSINKQHLSRICYFMIFHP
jgi:hypothetical protein